MGQKSKIKTIQSLCSGFQFKTLRQSFFFWPGFCFLKEQSDANKSFDIGKSNVGIPYSHIATICCCSTA